MGGADATHADVGAHIRRIGATPSAPPEIDEVQQMQNRNAIIFHNADESSAVRAGKTAKLCSALGIQADFFGLDAVDEVFAAVMENQVDFVIVSDFDPDLVLTLRSLRVPIIWRLAGLKPADVDPWLETDARRDALVAALARAECLIETPKAVRRTLEAALSQGAPDLDLRRALRWLETRVVVVLGAGLGNMMNATPVIRWIAEHQGAPVDVVIHQQGPHAVELFCMAPWVHRVFPNYAACVDRRYDIAIVSAIAAHLEPTFHAERWLPQHKLVDYNMDARLTLESEIYLLGLRTIWPDAPVRVEDLPPGFLRDADYAWSNNTIIGLANGIKEGVWAKRQWPLTAALAERLAADGWTVRTFGMPEELVPGTEDFTGLSISETIRAMGECSYFIGHDGGMTHMAETLGIPTVWLFGPTAHTKNGPLRAQSRLVSAALACSPCNFRVDWRRCETADCMSAISVGQVLDEFASLRSEMEKVGYHGWRWRSRDPALVGREYTAQFSAAHHSSVRPSVEAETNALVPSDPAVVARLGALLLRAGDADGVVRLLENRGGRVRDGSAILRVFWDLARLAAEDGCAEAELANIWTDGPEPVLADLERLRFHPDNRRIAFESLALHLSISSEPGDNQIARICDLFLAAAKRGALFEGIDEFLHERIIQTAVRPDQAIAASDILATERRSTLVGKVAFSPAERAFDDYAGQLGALIGASGKSVLDAQLAPNLAALGADRCAALTTLRLGGQEYHFSAFAPVLIVAPYVAPKTARPGSLSRLVTKTARDLAGHRLRPFVIDLMPSGGTAGVYFRDNVTYVGASRAWQPDDWRSCLSTIQPALIIRFNGAGDGVDTVDWSVLDVTVRGAYDAMGVAQGLASHIGWDLVKQSEAAANTVTGDVLSAELMAADPPRSGPARQPSLRAAALVLLNSEADLPPLLRVALSTPQFHFQIVCDCVRQAPYANVSFLRRSRLSSRRLQSIDRDVFIQFSTQPTDLGAEALEAVEHGAMVFAASGFADVYGGGAVSLVSVDEPEFPEVWRSVLLSWLADASASTA